jgi:DNA recombination protein RmuC
MVVSVVLGIAACVILALAVIILRQNSRIEEMLRMTADQFKSEQARSLVSEETRRMALEALVRSLEEKLKTYQDLLRQWENDRAAKFGQIEKELSNASQATLRLSDTTGKLTNILGNVKLRGQWGERMAEDIVSYAGLLEGINYLKQTAQASSSTRPDFIFLLPDGKKLNMDVKFPLDNYLKMANAASDLERDAAKKDFFKNVRARMKELQSREYINPAENTLDFVLLFIPNEQVFAFIHEAEPGIMDEALKEKILLCSPFTLYAVLSVVRQAHEHFRFEKDIKKILSHIDLFTKHFDTFKTRFEDIGALIRKLEEKYTDVRDVSFKNVDTKLRHIEEYRKGRLENVVEPAPLAEGEQ